MNHMYHEPNPSTVNHDAVLLHSGLDVKKHKVPYDKIFFLK